jgi:hypothetical protein
VPKPLRPHSTALNATLAEATDDPRERSDSLKRCSALIAAGCVGHGPLRAHPICARVALAIDDDAQARAHLDALSNLAPGRHDHPGSNPRRHGASGVGVRLDRATCSPTRRGAEATAWPTASAAFDLAICSSHQTLKPHLARCSFQAGGPFPNTPASLSPLGCRPSRIASTMSGARQVSGSSRQT